MPTMIVANPTCNVFCNRWINSEPIERLVSTELPKSPDVMMSPTHLPNCSGTDLLSPSCSSTWARRSSEMASPSPESAATGSPGRMRKMANEAIATMMTTTIDCSTRTVMYVHMAAS